MAGRPSNKKPSPQGARLASLRKAAGLSQMKLAEMIGKPQRTVSDYERAAETFPAALAAPIARALGVSLEELLGVDLKGPRRRGPKSKIERQFERVQKLPKQRQKFIGKLLDELLAGGNG